MESEFRGVIDALPGLVWTAGPDGHATFLNQRWLDYTGLAIDEALVAVWQAAIHPDDQPGLVAGWLDHAERGQAGEWEARIRRRDGVYRWFLFRAQPLRDESGKIVRWCGLSTDIEDRKRAEQELQRSEAFLAHGEAVSETGSFLWRLESGEIKWSEELYRIFEFEKGSLITLEHIGTRIHPEDLWMLDDMAANAKEGRGLRYDHRLLMPDGSDKHLHFVGRATCDADGRLEYIGTVQNMTARRLSELALSKVRSELAHVARVTSLNALTASIAHEVNQPLAGIVTNAGTCLRMLAADPPNVAGARETARRTIRDGNRASEVIARLRALFAKKAASVERVDLNEAVREVIALSVSELQRNRVVLRLEFADDLPFVTGDRVQLQQVILNLMLNASDAMSGVKSRMRQLTIRTERDENDSVRLSVRDSGAGFGSQGTEKLFDAFYSTKSDGMGIGLFVSRSIIESHHGRLLAAPNEGAGATFWFSIPHGPEAAEAGAQRSVVGITGQKGNLVGEIPMPNANDANVRRVP